MSEQVGFSTKHLPDNIEDLSKYVLVGRAQLTAVREAIRAIDKYGLAKEVREQKLQEGQEIAEAVTDAEVVMGRLLKEMPKAQGGRPTENPSTANDRFSKLSDLGISRDQSSQFQRMADPPEAVEKAKEEARENGAIVSRSQVLNKIKEADREKYDFRRPEQRARDEHREFEKKKQEDVVSFEDIKTDKANQEIISTDNAGTCLRFLTTAQSRLHYYRGHGLDEFKATFNIAASDIIVEALKDIASVSQELLIVAGNRKESHGGD